MGQGMRQSNFWTNKIICGDAASVLQRLPAESVDTVITSPPYYQQRQYKGERNSGGIGNEDYVSIYIIALLDVFDEIHRVVKPSGNIVFNLGDKYIGSSLALIPYHFAISVKNKFRDIQLVNDITWLKKNPTPRQYARRLVSSTESFFHFAKTPNYYYDRKAFLQNKEKVRNKPTRLLGKSYRGLIDRSKLTVFQKRLAHKKLDDVIEEVRQDRITGFRMKIKGIHSPAFGGQEGGRKSQMDRNGFTIIKINGDGMKKDAIVMAVESEPNIDHPAMFPPKLVGELIKLLTPPKGMVLDPFVGSGSTALAAIREGRNYCGIDICKEYCDMALTRIENEYRRQAVS